MIAKSTQGQEPATKPVNLVRMPPPAPDPFRAHTEALCTLGILSIAPNVMPICYRAKGSGAGERLFTIARSGGRLLTLSPTPYPLTSIPYTLPPMLIPPDILGLVFDCDGTIADTMPLHYEAWLAALGEHGVEFPEALFYQMAGIPTARIIELLNERHGHSMPVQLTADRKEELYVSLIPRVRPIAPVVRIIETYAGKLPMAVATGGTRAICTQTLSALGLVHHFAAIVTADDMQHGKPAPDIFIEAARRLNVAPHQCIAFEDADLGVQAASAAGMKVIDVRKDFPKASI